MHGSPIVLSETLRSYVKRYRESGVGGIASDNHKGRICRLSSNQTHLLRAYLDEYICLSTRDVIAFIAQHFSVSYNVSGVTNLLHRLGYVYKRPKVVQHGECREIKTNSGRQRININGAINIQNMDVQYRFDKTINADSVIALYQQIEAVNPSAQSIYLIQDNARVHHAKQVYLLTPLARVLRINSQYMATRPCTFVLQLLPKSVPTS